MSNVKKLYKKLEILVSDDLITSDDATITAAIPDVSAGMIIYNAGKSIVKQLSLDGRWVPVQIGANGSGDIDGTSLVWSDI